MSVRKKFDVSFVAIKSMLLPIHLPIRSTENIMYSCLYMYCHGQCEIILTYDCRERNDPALYDKELHSKLNANKVQWKSSMDEVMHRL